MSDKHPDALPVPVGALADTGRSLRHVWQSILGCLMLGLAVTVWTRNIRALEWSVIAGLVMAGGLLVGRVLLDALVEAAEMLTQRDINGDGVLGPERIVLVNKPVKDDRQRWVDFVRQAAIDSTLPAMMEHGYTRSEWENGRNRLIMVGLADWKGDGHTTGWELTQSVDDVLSALPYFPLDDDLRTV